MFSKPLASSTRVFTLNNQLAPIKKLKAAFLQYSLLKGDKP